MGLVKAAEAGLATEAAEAEAEEGGHQAPMSGWVLVVPLVLVSRVSFYLNGKQNDRSKLFNR